MKLRERVPKHDGRGRHREVSAAQTYERVAPYLRTMGITRVSEITWLDRVGIPVFNAIMPRSNDKLSVYNGKGLTAADARTSAVMEAAERFCAWQPRPPDRIASYAELASGPEPVLDPASHNLALSPRYRPDLPISWTYGFDLLRGERVLVPLHLAGYYIRFHEVGCYRLTTTNGIASGNSLEEAICHGLCEVIERDGWTLAELISGALVKTINSRLPGGAPPRASARLAMRHPRIDLGTLPPAAAELAARLTDAGIRLVLRDTTSATAIPSVAAMTYERLADGLSTGHAGYAAHPDAEVAVIRALTEVAQSRVVDIQGMREDLSHADDSVQPWNQHAQRATDIDMTSWPHEDSGRVVAFGDLPSHPSDDITADIRLMLSRLRAVGIERAIAIDLSVPGLPVRVAKVIVPGMESFGLDRSRLGKRAAAEWDAVLAEMIAERDALRLDHQGVS